VRPDAMLTHLFAIIGLMALCAFWVLFQLWLKRVDPDQRDSNERCMGCNSCSRKTKTE